MSTTSIRIERETHERLQELAKTQGRSMTRIISEAIAKYEEDLFWRKAREGYERLNSDPEDRAAYDAEMALWDTALSDGMEEFPFEEDE